METPKIDAKVAELESMLDSAIARGDRPSVESIRGSLAALLIAREEIKNQNGGQE